MFHIAIISSIVQITIFKYYYPYAGFFHGGSYVYLEAAMQNLGANVYPVGYSKFLRVFSTFTRSDTALVIFQYFLLQSSVLYFSLSLSFLYKPHIVVSRAIFLILLCNPIFLYISNYITSDALFISLSVYWFTTSLWILYNVKNWLIIVNAVTLLLAFSTRYSALYYPFITVLLYLCCKTKYVIKILAVSINLVLILAFIYHTSNQFVKLTGISQFSPFSGWQTANNALYAYRYAQMNDTIIPIRFERLHKMVHVYYDTTRNLFINPQETQLSDAWYMWNFKSPLYIYMMRYYRKDTLTITNLRAWASVAPLYKEYGVYLIRSHPSEFLHFHVIPNTIKYFFPPPEFLSSYNMGKDTVGEMIQQWFQYKDNRVNTRFKEKQVNILNQYPNIFGVMNILFFCLLFAFLLQSEKSTFFAHSIYIVTFFLLTHMCFSILAAPISLRFQVVSFVILLGFLLLLLNFLYKVLLSTNKNIESH